MQGEHVVLLIDIMWGSTVLIENELKEFTNWGVRKDMRFKVEWDGNGASEVFHARPHMDTRPTQ